jgi:hypothetical protein
MKKIIKKSSVKKMQTGGKLSKAELSALAHQKRGKGDIDFNSGYVKSSDPIMNRTGFLTADQRKQLKEYMNKSSIGEKVYQSLPNVGRMFGEGKSAADLPKGSKLKQKMGGVTKKAKSGGSFPDLNKDGKITKADILKGRGVIAKKGATLKKQAAVAIAMKKAGKTPKAQTGNNIKVNPPAGYTKGSGYKSFGKSGVSVKKMQYGGAAASMVPPMMKKGGATKKCKYGCK